MKYVKHLWNKWKKIAEFIGGIQASIAFSILYFLIFVPAGVIVTFSKDYLRIKSGAKWLMMENNSKNFEELKEQ